MKVTFADSFWKSLDTIRRHDTWWYKLYDVFRYGIPNFLKNLWFFRKNLWEFRGWDYTYNLSLFARSLEKTSEVLVKGDEIAITRIKKVEKINRLIEIIAIMRESSYVSKAVEELGELKRVNEWWLSDDEHTPEENEHNRKVFDRAHEIEKQLWNEFWSILKGQNLDEYAELLKKLPDEKNSNHDTWDNWFDGTGIKHWWD